MRVCLAAFFIGLAPAVLAADLSGEPSGVFDQADEVVIERPVRRTILVQTACVTCPGSRLPLGGLGKPAVAHVPLGGLRKACPPVRSSRTTVLRVKG